MSRGLQLALLGAGMCLLASAFAVPALYVPGVTLLLVALAATVSVSAAARGAGVELDVNAQSVEEGEHVTVRARLTGGLAGSCRGQLRVLPEAPGAPLGWGARSAEQQVRTARRGRVIVGPATVRWADPFQICCREQASATRELLVLPRVQALRRSDVQRLLSLPDAGRSSEAGLEPDGLRPYRPGAPASRIHWLTVARTGALMERGFCEEAGRAPVTVILDARAPGGPDALDKAVRATASLCAGLARAGGCTVLLPGRTGAERLGAALEGWPHVHALLALVEGGAPRWELARDSRRIVLVQAGPPHAPQGIAVSCSVSPLPDPRTAVMFRIAGCAVQAAGGASRERAA